MREPCLVVVATGVGCRAASASAAGNGGDNSVSTYASHTPGIQFADVEATVGADSYREGTGQLGTSGLAAVATWPVGEKHEAPVPATVVIIPSGATRRTRLALGVAM